MKILILGATGQIGRNLLKHLVNRREELAIKSLGVTYRSNHSILNLPSHIDYFKFDIMDGSKINKIFKEIKYDVVINLLHDTSKEFNQSKEFSEKIKTMYQNIFKVINFVKASRVLFSSSGAVYGMDTSKENGFDEQDIDINSKKISLDNYSQSKLYFEQKLNDWSLLNKKRSYLIFRVFSVYGEDSRKDAYHALTEFADLRRAGKDIIIKSPQTTRSFLHLDDLSDWVIKLIDDRKNLILNFSSKNIYSMKKLAKLVSLTQCNYKKIDVKIESDGTVPTRYFGSNQLRKSLGLKEVQDFKKCIKSQINQG
jgi:nucleoside-diphosphate-sugar epimerase